MRALDERTLKDCAQNYKNITKRDSGTRITENREIRSRRKRRRDVQHLPKVGGGDGRPNERI